MDVVAQHDPIVKQCLTQKPRSAMYCYPKIQNMLLHIMGDILWKQISEAVVQAGYFSLLADESKHASRKEQLAIVLRYVDEKAIIHERFPSFVEATNLTAESLATYLIPTLTEHQLDPACTVTQEYDGPSVMSGSCCGVQQ